MPSNKKLLQAAAGSAGGDKLYVEDVFSTYVYTGNQTSRTIDNGIALSDEGGLVWLKSRSNADSHYLFDTVNGSEKTLSSDNTAAGSDYSDYWDFPSAGTEGFKLLDAPANYSGWTLASWTFRKAEKFFDIVTYTGDGTNSKSISHNLGSVPAMMFVKRTNTAQYWITYNGTDGYTKYQILNSTQSSQTAAGYWVQAPTSTSFTVGDLYNDGGVNGNGDTYVAYLFASDAGGFGDDGTESIIKCGTYTEAASSFEVTLGWEPQFILAKPISKNGSWYLLDTMRGFNHTADRRLEANDSVAEDTTAYAYWSPTATGFNTPAAYWGAGTEVIYMAIRRPMKTPTAGTEVFAIDTPSSTAAGDILTSGFVDDTIFQKYRTLSSGFTSASRLTGKGVLTLSSTNDENTSQDRYGFDVQDGVELIIGDGSYPMLYYHFRRAAGFFDELCYTGDGGRRAALTHNLGVVPELVIVKSRSATGNWFTLSTSLGQFGFLNNGDGFSTTDIQYAFGDGTNYVAPTSTALQVDSSINGNTQTFVAYLFATVAGVSKVGTYTGTGTTHNIDCGFTGGARFVMIKRADGSTNTGDWYVWDSLRGIVAGNDPYLLLNSTAAEVTNTDYIDPLNAGFTVTSSAPAALNASSGTYIFLAIA